MHGQSINSLVLFEQLEWRNADRDALAWDTKGWVGRDLDRFWLRTEGDAEDGGVQEAQLHLLYGRAIARWWDLVAGVRQDWRPGPAQTWAAVGLQGIAPYFFDVEATGYIGAEGRTHVRFEAAYDLLLTNRLIAQPLLEFELAGKADPVRRVGTGLTVGEISIRLRYEVRREFAPYVGLLWRRTFFGTADMARLDGRGTGGTSVSAGGRVWF
ncbi:MAG: copper resistance protein B [Vicinamibacterales bacterium]